MDEILYTYLDNYYKQLCTLGYTDDNTTYKLLILSFLDDVLPYIDTDKAPEDYYEVLENALNCIINSSCIMPYMKINTNNSKIARLPREMEYSKSDIDVLKEKIESLELSISNIEDARVLRVAED